MREQPSEEELVADVTRPKFVPELARIAFVERFRIDRRLAPGVEAFHVHPRGGALA